MSRSLTDLDRARAEVTAASSGGAPFLFAFALTLGLTGIAAFWLDVRTTAVITLFQGNAALPLAFGLERVMSDVRLSDDNPLKPLSIQLAMSQILALPIVVEGARPKRWAITRHEERAARPREMFSRSAAVSTRADRRRTGGGMPPWARPIAGTHSPRFHRIQNSASSATVNGNRCIRDIFSSSHGASTH